MAEPRYIISHNNKILADFVLAEQGKEYRLGRASDNDIIVDDPRISRHHLTILWDWNNAVVVFDLGSVNHLTVNGLQIVDRISIEPSDTVLLGDLKVSRVLPEKPPEPMPVTLEPADVKPKSTTRIYTVLLICGIILTISALVLIGTMVF